MRVYFPIIMAAGLVSIQADRADACGLKLSKKAVKISEPIRPSPNPSRILLAGGAPRSLGRVLGQAGHIVETSDTLEPVRNEEFRVVFVDDPELGNRAREYWPQAHVLAVSDRTRGDLYAVEKVLRRDGGTGGTLVAAAERRVPVAAGPNAKGDETDRKFVTAGPDEGEKLAAKEDVAPAEETAVVAAREEQPEPKEEPQPREQEKAEDEPIVVAKAEKVREAEPEPEPEPVVEKPVKVAKRTRRVEKKAEPAPEPEVEEAPVKVSRAARTETVSLPDEREVQFFAASSRVVGRYRKVLNRMAKYLKQNPNVSVVIEGHASTDGADEFNERIAERRARAVMQSLLRRGVSSTQMETASFGESRPKYEPSSAPENRRVEIVVKE